MIQNDAGTGTDADADEWAAGASAEHEQSVRLSIDLTLFWWADLVGWFGSIWVYLVGWFGSIWVYFTQDAEAGRKPESGPRLFLDI